MDYIWSKQTQERPAARELEEQQRKAEDEQSASSLDLSAFTSDNDAPGELWLCLASLDTRIAQHARYTTCSSGAGTLLNQVAACAELCNGKRHINTSETCKFSVAKTRAHTCRRRAGHPRRAQRYTPMVCNVSPCSETANRWRTCSA